MEKFKSTHKIREKIGYNERVSKYRRYRRHNTYNVKRKKSISVKTEIIRMGCRMNKQNKQTSKKYQHPAMFLLRRNISINSWEMLKVIK